MTDEGLITLMHEVSAIVNCRPLSHVNLSDSSIEPLTPYHLLTQKSRVIISPPGEFVRQDIYLRKRWRQVQYLANVFWNRWRQEYLDTVNRRRKWNGSRRNVAVNDVVLVVDENSARNEWKMGSVVEVFTSDDGLVRSVKIQLASNELDQKGTRMAEPTILKRPVHKLIMLIEA